ncbi:hypothetical protein CMV_003886 [Castanea mollissima]|uniref:Uncharacterized protein n=1 Tax=Castanea mollissima TaxID=60419 RepID=A0A8J4RRH9_9ROSI|nr:hypothetical protein CMV_003886 [Castanea mollissima]
MEEYLSHHSGELQIGDSTIGPSGIGSNSQSLVELHNGHSVAIMGGGRSFEQAEKTIGGALLRRIKMVDSGKEISRPEGNGNSTYGEPPDPEANSDPCSGLGDQGWKWEAISFELPSSINDRIKAIPRQHVGRKEDTIIWRYSKDGECTTKLAYASINGPQ